VGSPTIRSYVLRTPRELEFAMKRKVSETGHSMRMMWGCAALVLLALIVAFAANAYVLLFVVPCMLMMGAMVWMMMGGMGDGTHGERK